MNKALVIAEIALVTIIQVIITNKDSVAALYITTMLHTHKKKRCGIKPSIGINNGQLHDGLYLTNFKNAPLRNHTNLLMIPR